MLPERTNPLWHALLFSLHTERTTLSHIFTELGYSVRSAEDGFSALFEIRQEIPDVILSDLNMPGMSGFEFLSVVRRRFPGIHVIAMSGAFSGDGVQPGVAADAFYEKATGLGSLLQIVEAVTHPERPTIQLHNRLAPSGFRATDMTLPERRTS